MLTCRPVISNSAGYLTFLRTWFQCFRSRRDVNWLESSEGCPSAKRDPPPARPAKGGEGWLCPLTPGQQRNRLLWPRVPCGQICLLPAENLAVPGSGVNFLLVASAPFEKDWASMSIDPK